MNTSTLPQLYRPTVTVVAPLPAPSGLPTPEEQWFAGFHQYADCARDGDYLTQEELDAMTPTERKGYRDAISAADYSEWSAYRESTNSFCDRTEW